MAPQSCAVCGTETTLRCSGCQTAYYCGAEHTKQDWPKHKEYCKSIKKAGSNTFNAILFPEDEVKPRLIKVPWSWVDEEVTEYTRPFQLMDTKIWFKRQYSAAQEYKIQRLGLSGPPLGYTLAFIFDDNFTMNDSPPNACLEALLGDKLGRTWCGNLIFLRTDWEFGMVYHHYADVDMEKDMAPILKYFEEYGKVTPEWDY